MKTITTTGSINYINKGDTLEIIKLDFRWWKKLWHIILFKKPPIIREKYRVISTDFATTITIERK